MDGWMCVDEGEADHLTELCLIFFVEFTVI